MAKASKDRLKLTKGDYGHAAARAVLSVIPFAGGALVEALSLIVAEPLSERRDAWIIDLAAKLDELMKKVDGLQPEALSKHEAFITAFAHASQASMRAHQADKRQALRNAVLNVAIGTAPAEDLQLIFLHLIDRFTPWHLRILSLMQKPSGNAAARQKAQGLMSGAFSDILEAAFPDLTGQRRFYDLVIKDLHDTGLVGTSSVHGMATASGLLDRGTTELGDSFLQFISEPE